MGRKKQKEVDDYWTSADAEADYMLSNSREALNLNEYSNADVIEHEEDDGFMALLKQAKTGSQKKKDKKSKKKSEKKSGNAFEALMFEEGEVIDLDALANKAKEEEGEDRGDEGKGEKMEENEEMGDLDGLENEFGEMAVEEKKKSNNNKKKKKKSNQNVEKKNNNKKEEDDFLNELLKEKKKKQEEEKKEQVEEDKVEGEKAEEDNEEKEGANKKKKKKKKKSGDKAEEKVEEEPKEEKEKTQKEKPSKKNNAAIAALKERILAQQKLEEEQRRLEEEEERKRLEEERKIEEEKMREEAKKKRKKEREKQKKEELRKQGKLLTKAEKEKQQKNKLVLEQLQQQGVSFPKEGAKKFSIYDIKKKKKIENKKEEKIEKEEEEIKDSWEDDEVVEDWEIDEIKKDEKEEEKEEKKEIKEEKIKVETKPQSTKPQIVKKALKTNKDLRSPICCILGHVDTGKTKLLDKIRQTNVQEGEAGGITQQIGATYFPASVIQEKTIDLQDQFDLEVPGLLVIDTPGHESFTNLRTRGSSLCNIAVLVVDIMHGLEPQTLESISLLRQRKTPFIVALNKIDRIYGWQEYPNKPFNYSFEKQSESVKKEYHERLRSTILSFAEQGLNAIEYYNNNDYRKYVSLVPTSAITGEGIPDLLYLLIHLTQKMMSKSLMYLSELECTVLEVKVIEGLGTTIDVILSNGILREGDKIAVCGLNGPIITTIRALLTPQPLRELRVKSQYVHHKMVKAALGVKIVASDLDKAIAGSRLIKIEDDEDEDEAAEEVMTDLTTLLNSIDKSGRGVCVQASTLGSLEALLSFLKDSKIPVSGVNIGPVHKKDVIRTSIMLEHAREYAVLLAFDVKVDKDAQELADQLGIKIFKAEIIYHLFDHFTNYMKELIEQKKKDSAPQAIFPCVLRIVSGCVFNKRDPIVVGVDVIEGTLRVGTPICVPSQNNVFIGKVSSIEMNHKPQDSAKKGGPSVAIRIDTPSYDTPKMVGRHFTEKDDLVSQITRASIDVLKENFRNEMTNDDWQLIIKLKKALNIQ